MSNEAIRFIFSFAHAYALIYMMSASCIVAFAVFGLETKKPTVVEKVLTAMFVPCFLVTLYRIAQSII